MRATHGIFQAAVILFFTCVSCDNDDSNTTVSSIKSNLRTDTWRISYFFDSQDETQHFANYVFTFNEDGTVVAVKDISAVSGNWSLSQSDGKIRLMLDFVTTEPFDDLNDDWIVVEHSDKLLQLEDVSGGSGETDLLTFEKIL